MKIKAFNFVSILLLVIINTYSQNTITRGKVIYKVSLNKKKSQSKHKKNFHLIKDLLEASNDVDAVLYFNRQESFFKVIEKMENESESKINLTRVLVSKSYYTNLVNNTFLFSKDNYIVSYKKPEWKLSQVTKIIGGYLCYKATEISNNQKSPHIVWYTLDIPFGFGPARFNGLPGLVLEEFDNVLHYKAIKIELNNKKSIDKKIQKPQKGKRVTEKEYIKILNNSYPFLFKKSKKH